MISKRSSEEVPASAWADRALLGREADLWGCGSGSISFGPAGRSPSPSKSRAAPARPSELESRPLEKPDLKLFEQLAVIEQKLDALAARLDGDLARPPAAGRAPAEAKARVQEGCGAQGAGPEAAGQPPSLREGKVEDHRLSTREEAVSLLEASHSGAGATLRLQSGRIVPRKSRASRHSVQGVDRMGVAPVESPPKIALDNNAKGVDKKVKKQFDRLDNRRKGHLDAEDCQKVLALIGSDHDLEVLGHTLGLLMMEASASAPTSRRSDGFFDDSLTPSGFAHLLHTKRIPTGWKPECQAAAHDLRKALFHESQEFAASAAMSSSSGKLDGGKKEDRPRSETLILDTVPAFVIVLNAAVIGLSADIGQESPVWDYFEYFFTGFFTLEMVVRLWLETHYGEHPLALLRGYFFGPNKWWNWFDVLCLGLAYADLVITTMLSTVVSAGEMSQLMMLKIVRLARLTRLVRLLKFKIFNELKMMIQGVFSGLKVLMWAIILFFFVIFLLGIVGRKFFGDDHAEFASMPAAMFSMFRCFTDGCSTYNGAPLQEALRNDYGGIFMVCYFLTFLFVTIGIFNLIMAIFIDNVTAAQLVRKQRELSASGHEQEQKLKACFIEFQGMELERLRGEGGKDAADMTIKDVEITRDLFNTWIEDQTLVHMLTDCDVEVANKFEIFDVLDVEMDGVLSLDQLVGGLMRLRGPVSKNDIMAVRLKVRYITQVAETILECLIDEDDDSAGA